MANTLKLEIVTPAGTVYSEDVEMVTLPGVAGQMGILPQHVPLISQMVPGEMIVRKDGRDLFVATIPANNLAISACKVWRTTVNAKILDTLLTAIKRVSSESLKTEQDGYSSLSLNEEAFFESRGTRMSC